MGSFLGELIVAFEEMGLTITEPILDKCADICKRYNVNDAEEFVAAWMSYSISKLGGADISFVHLDKFERDEFKKKVRDSWKDTGKSSLVLYESQSHVDDETDNIMKVYSENAAKGNNSQTCTPDRFKSGSKSGPHIFLSPASFSPATESPSSKYATRTNSGEVVFPYSSEIFKSVHDGPVSTVELLSGMNVTRHMNFQLVDALEYMDSNIEELGKILKEKNQIDNYMPVRYKYPAPFATVGIIMCDSDGRLNSKSVMLEGSRELSMGEVVQLELGGAEKYWLFPGQVVAVEGMNVTGDKLLAKKIHCDASADPEPSRSRGSLSMIIAAGPYTQCDVLTYGPLADLMEVVVNEEPDLLILTGPFMDHSHPVIQKNTTAETYSDMFKKTVDLIMRRLNGKKTRVAMVSSHADCHSPYVYPTPKYNVEDKNYRNLHLLPDPSIIDVNGVVIGVTSTDVLMHVGGEEICSPGFSTNRLIRIASHLLSQRSFYPLSPSTRVPIDPSLMNFAKLDIRPDILIVPSDLRYFIKELPGCVVVNPERLAKGLIGGTFVRLNLTSTGLTGNITRI